MAWKRAVLAALLLCVFAAPSRATEASCYGRENHQVRTATGQSYNPWKITAAYWFAPLGTLLRVLNLNNGRAATVQVNDRGPAKRLVRKGRSIDLSLGACRAIGSNGLARVSLTVVSKPHHH